MSQTHADKKIYLASDHAGFAQKEAIKKWLQEQEAQVVDCGAFGLDEEDDFPDFISKAAKAVSENASNTIAIIFGGSGEGEAMLANRYVNVRATVYYGGSSDILTLSRSHNDANILSIGARFVSLEDTKKAVRIWLAAPFGGEEKRVRRNRKIEQLSK